MELKNNHTSHNRSRQKGNLSGVKSHEVLRNNYTYKVKQ